MSNDQNTKSPPSHRIYSITKSAGGNSNWTEIGAAWPNKDGKGFNLTFNARPLEGAQIVLRSIKAKRPDATSKRGTAGRYAELNGHDHR